MGRNSILSVIKNSFNKDEHSNKPRVFLIVVSILISLFIWLFLVDPVKNMTLTVPIDIVGLEGNDVIENKDFILVNTVVPNTVDITVSGRQSYLKNITKSSIKAVADFSNVEDIDQTRLKISSQFGQTDLQGVRIVSQYPNDFAIKLDTFSGSTVPVEVKTTGTPKLGFDVMSATTDNKFIQLTGGNAIISKVNKAVVNVDVSDFGESFQALRYAKIVDSNGNEIAGTEKKYKIGVRVEIAKKVIVNPVLVGNVSDSYQYEPGTATISPSTIYLYGSYKLLGGISSVSTEQIDISNLKKTSVISAKLQVPENTRIDGGVSSVNVTIPISYKKSQTVTINRSEIELLRKNSAFIYNLSPKTFEITVVGTVAEIDSFLKSKIKGNIDVSTLPIGQHSVNVSFNNSAKLEIKNAPTLSLDITQ